MKTQAPSPQRLTKFFAINFFILALLFSSKCNNGGSNNQPAVDASLQQALTLVANQKNETEEVVRQLRSKLSTQDAARFRTGHIDMVGIFNGIIDGIKTGNAGSASDTEIRNGVRLNRAWIEEANNTLSASFPALDESAVSAAWIKIRQAAQTLSENQKKQIFKSLDKNARWQPWNKI